MLTGCGGGALSVTDPAVCQKAQAYIDVGGGADAAVALTDVGNAAGDALGDAARTFGRYGSDGNSWLDLSPWFFGEAARPRPATGPTFRLEGPLPIAVPSAVASAVSTLRASCHLRI
jgi:hypothetical protein